MITLTEYAKDKLKQNGMYETEYCSKIADNVLELIEVFEKQKHSGFTASCTIEIFSKLASWQDI